MKILALVPAVICLLAINCTSGKAQMNSVLNIYDNRAPENTTAVSDWGFSVYVEYNGRKILFDSGRRAGILEKNAAMEKENAARNHPRNGEPASSRGSPRRNPPTTPSPARA